MRKTIEVLIRIGKSTKEIQRTINDFPNIITTEYFKELGFEEIEAIKLKWKLRQNDRKEAEEEKAEKARYELLKRKTFIFSANANPNFIIMDTCALQFKQSIEVIEKSEKVIVIESILKEMEKVQRKIKYKKNITSKNNYLSTHIIKYKGKIASECKYKKVLDAGRDKYVDNKVLYYLSNLPEEKRPTLLTADINLANRANCYGLEYILFINKAKKTKKNNKKKKVVETKKSEEPKKCNVKSEKDKIKNKINLYGVSFKLIEEQILIRKFNPNTQVYFVKQNKKQVVKKLDKIGLNQIDYIILLMRRKKAREIRVVKLVVVNNQIRYDVEKIKFINEIYQLAIPEEIQEEARKILIE